MKYRKKPVVIEAVQLTWSTWGEMCTHAGVGKLSEGKPEGCYIGPDGKQHGHPGGPDDKIGLVIPTLEGVMVGVEGDWIIKGVKGEIYPCKPDIFAATYEAVEEDVVALPETVETLFGFKEGFALFGHEYGVSQSMVAAMRAAFGAGMQLRDVVKESRERLARERDGYKADVEDLRSQIEDFKLKEARGPRIYTKCPACRKDTLTVNGDKHLLCTWVECPNPTLIDEMGTEWSARIVDLEVENQRLTAERDLCYAELNSILRTWCAMDLSDPESTPDGMAQGVVLEAVSNVFNDEARRIDILRREKAANGRALRYAEEQLTLLAKFIGRDGTTWAHVVSHAVSVIERMRDALNSIYAPGASYLETRKAVLVAKEEAAAFHARRAAVFSDLPWATTRGPSTPLRCAQDDNGGAI